ncbi:MAG: STAS domain-containing protein [Leptospiraceae bacterium]
MIRAEKKEDTIILHVLEPRVDMVVARKFREGLTQHIQDRPQKIVLNLADTEYFDSSALGALVAFMKDVRAYGGRLILCNLSRSLLALLKLSKLDMLFEISESLDSALSS